MKWRKVKCDQAPRCPEERDGARALSLHILDFNIAGKDWIYDWICLPQLVVRIFVTINKAFNIKKRHGAPLEFLLPFLVVEYYGFPCLISLTSCKAESNLAWSSASRSLNCCLPIPRRSLSQRMARWNTWPMLRPRLCQIKSRVHGNSSFLKILNVSMISFRYNNI